MSKEAIILAGGRGTRLRPYTAILPKPLMPIGEKCILDIIIEQLAGQGFEKITLAVNHQADLIKAFAGSGERYGINISYSLETKALSTMAPLKLIKGLPENFLVMNGDVLTDINYGRFFDNHVSNKDLFTISAYRRENQVDYGVLEVNSESVLTNFKEKPSDTFLVSMGVYMLNKEVLGFIPEETAFGFDHLMHKLLEHKRSVAVKEHTGEWLDIGRPDDYDKALELYEKMSEKK